MAQQPQRISQIYKKFTDTFSPTENPRDVVRFAKRRLSVDLKYGDVKKFLTDKKKWDERVCEPLDSEFGQDWFIETVQQSSYYQKWIIDCYFKQKHHTTCSLVSLAIILNAKLLSNYYLSKYGDDDDDEDGDDNDNKIEFDSDDEEDMDTLKATLPFLTESKLIHIFPQYSSRLTIDKVLVSGMSLDELGQVLLDFGSKSVVIHHCDNNNNNNKETVSSFRVLCRSIFSKHNMDIDGAIICNFDLWELDTGIEGGVYGHMSPIAAYHEDSDRVLLLDVFTDEYWVKIESLYKAMSTAAGKTGKYRGYVVVNGPPIFNESINNNNYNNNDSEEGSVNDTKPNNTNNTNINDDIKEIKIRKSRHRNNNSSIDFDFVFDVKQNYNDKAQSQQTMTKRTKQRRNSRRESKKLRLYLEFDNENGQKLWAETQSSPYHQKYIVVEYFQQNKAASYGLVTMAIIFNAKTTAFYHNNDDQKNNNDQYIIDEDEIIKMDEDKIISLYEKYYNDYNENNKNKTFSVPKISNILSHGMSLEESGNILKLFGCKRVSIMHTFEMEMDEFRNLIKDTLKKGTQTNDVVMMVNYDLLKLGTGIANGHIASIAGYNIKNDMVLLMDVMWIIGKCWIPLHLLYQSMNTIDDNTAKYRGCIIVDGIPLF